MPQPPTQRDLVPTLTEELVELRLPRFTLRMVRESDAEELFAWVRDPELPRLMTWSPHANVEETSGVIRMQREAFAKQTDVMWMIEIDGVIAGCVGLHGIKWEARALRRDSAFIGYWIAASYRNRGIVSEATRMVLAFAFETLGLHKVTVSCFGTNDASRRVIEKCGFRAVGIAREDVWRDGVWHDHLLYEMTIGEWNGSRDRRP
jgi:[ribosomal protein S5]-alanine N-acetyltransferase